MTSPGDTEHKNGRQLPDSGTFRQSAAPPPPNTHQYDHVHARLHQQIQSVLVVVPGADGGPAQELFARVFGGQRIVSVLLQIRPGDDGHQLIVIINNGKFAWRKRAPKCLKYRQKRGVRELSSCPVCVCVCGGGVRYLSYCAAEYHWLL